MKTLFRNGSIHTMNGTEVVHSLLVEDGRILEEGTPEHFFDNPENPRCREFLSKILH